MLNRRRWLTAIATLLFATAGVAQYSGPGVALRGNRAEVEARYQEISQSTSLRDRQEIFQALSPEMRTDLWLISLEKFLVSHPELSSAQRDVVVEAIGILATELPGRVDGVGRHYADERMQRFSSRAKAALPKHLFLEAFGQVGPRSSLDSPRKRDAAERRIIGNPIPPEGGNVDCTCSHTDNFCSDPTTPTPYCNRQRGCRLVASGCGWWWAETCDGLCSTTDG